MYKHQKWLIFAHLNTPKSEANNAGFWIERQAEGQDAFQSLGFVPPAAGEGRRAYRFADRAPMPGWNHYRVRQQDHDGNLSYSAIRAARCHEVATEAAPGSLYPNPLSPGSPFSIRGMAPDQAARLQWVWTDAYGRVVQQHNSCYVPARLAAGCYALRGFSSAGELRYAFKACISNL